MTYASQCSSPVILQIPLASRSAIDRLVATSSLSGSDEQVSRVLVVRLRCQLRTYAARYNARLTERPGGMICQRSGDWNSYVLASAATVAFKKLPWVAVDPLDWARVSDRRTHRLVRPTVAVLDTGELEHSLGGRGGDDTGTSGGGDQSAHDGSRLSGNLARDSVRLGDVRTPVSSSNGDDRKLGDDDGSSDGGSDLLGALDTESDVAGVSHCEIQHLISAGGSRDRSATHPSESPTATNALNRVR